MKPGHAFAPKLGLLALLSGFPIANAAESRIRMFAHQWLANRPITAAVLADFPSADHISVRGEIPLPTGP